MLIALGFVASCGLLAQPAAQAQGADGAAVMESDAFAAGAPMVESGGGSFFSQELGTLLRLRYNTESYGQDRRGNFDIGTMQVANFDDAIAFFDGQATLSDVNGVGYNLGVGFRWLTASPFLIEPERITGFSFWTDGTSTESGNFFPQVGVSFESLGDMWDLRINGYVPVGQESQVGTFSPTGAISFDQNFLVQQAVADRNTSFNVAEAEIARRIMPDRDAWGFAGPYVLVNEDEDAAGYRVGVRGYAYPDLMVQLAVTDDDIFKTNAAFQVTWFVGRTRSNFQPAYGLADRMREPVYRNDYVALKRTQEIGGTALTNSDGEAIRFVHVDSSAAAGGNGTYENPLNNVGNVNANSQNGDIVLLWSDSVFQSQNTLVAKDNQRILGEGNGEFFTVTTQQQGVVVIPETSPGARDGARPLIMDALGLGAVRLADTNEVANFNIDGSAGAGIFSPTTGAGNPNIHDMNIANTTGDGIQFTPLTRPDEDNPTLKTVAGNVTIADLVFDNIGGDDININSETATNVTDPNVTLQETIAISNVTSTNGQGRGVWLRNTHDNRTATITNYTNGILGTAGSGGGLGGVGVLVFEGTATDQFEGNVTLTNIDIFNNEGFALDFLNVDATSATTITSGNGLTYNGGTGAAGGMRFDNFNGSITANSSTLEGGTLEGVQIIGDSDGTFTFASTVTFTNIDGTTIDIDGGSSHTFTGTATFAGAITNDTGRTVSIQGASGDASVTISGDITETSASEGILVNDNTAGTILFSGDINQTLTNNTGITLTDNTGADINFGGEMNIDISGTGNAFDASGGGTLTVSNTNNSVSTASGVAVAISDMTISSAGANFANVDVTSSATNGVTLTDNTGGAILIGTVGDSAGDSGTIEGTLGAGVLIENSANVTVSGLVINSEAGQTGVSITKDTTGTQTVNLNDLEINDGAVGIDVIGNGTGTLNMTVNDTAVNDPTQFGLRIDNIDSGTIQANALTLDGNLANNNAQGVLISNSNATINFDSATLIQNFDGTGFEVDATAGTISYAGDVINDATAAGNSVYVHDVTGGSVQFTSASTIDDNGLGMLVQDNTGGTISFLGTNDFDPVAGAAQAVLVDNNDGATVTFAGLNINTTTASSTRGLVATNGGTLSVTGTTNVINTENGAGLVLTDMTIGSVDLQTVTVDGGTGPVNAILLQNLTGGQVEIGTTSGAQNSGGILRSTGDAIVIQNVQNAALRDMQIVSAGGRGVAVTHNTSATTNSDVTLDGLNLDSSTGNGVEVTAASNANQFIMRINGNSDLEENVVAAATGSGLFQMKVENTAINVTGTTDAFATTISGSATNVDMILSNTNFTADDASAVSLVTSGGTGKTFDLLVENGTFTNSSAANPAAEFTSGGNTTYNATIRGNSFDNGDAAGSDFTMTSNGAQARVRLNLGSDDSTEMNSAIGQGEFNLVEAGSSDFDVFEKDDTFNNLRNNGTVVPNPNAAAFDDLLVAPTVPVIP